MLAPMVLGPGNAVEYLVTRGLLPPDTAAEACELAGGVSATVIAVRSAAGGVVVKQALARLRVEREWRANPKRIEVEAAALRLLGALTPDRLPRLVDVDPDRHVLVMQLLPADARNWQDEVAVGNVHVAAGRFAGETLAIWHAGTAGDPAVARAFGDLEPFEELRLEPFFETVIEQLPALEPAIAPRLAELRERCVCLVHGDYAMKNMLVGPSGRFVLDLEVAHYGNPVFDLAFFLSYVVLSALRWPGLTAELEQLAAGFLDAYRERAGTEVAPDPASLIAHAACLILARTDGKSPALFFDPPTRERARAIGIGLLHRPEQGLWSWR